MARRALCIGINDYPGTQQDLQGCVNDARDWEAALKSRDYDVAILLDGEATLQNLKRRIGALVEQSARGDILVITFSGHGTWVPDASGDEDDGRDEALCPYDIGKSGPLLDDDLHDLFAERERGVRIVLISDSCHSGTVAKVAPRGSDSDAHAPRIRFLPPSTFLKAEALARAESIRRAPRTRPLRFPSLLLAGCQDHEYSYDAFFNGRANGAFTRAALDALKSLPKSATYSDWFKAVRRALPSVHYPQSPNLAGTRSQRQWAVLEPGTAPARA